MGENMCHIIDKIIFKMQNCYKCVRPKLNSTKKQLSFVWGKKI